MGITLNNAEILREMCGNKLNTIFKPEEFKRFACHFGSIQRYSFLNRLIIYTQNNNRSDIREASAWVRLGRKVSEKALPIYVVDENTEFKYIDSESKEINLSDINLEELEAAIKLGVVKKVLDDTELKLIKVYDISDTFEASRCVQVNYPKFSVDTLYKYIQNSGLNPSVGVDSKGISESKYDISNNTLLISKDIGYKAVGICIDIVFTICERKINSIIGNCEISKELIKKYIKYSVLTYFGMNGQADEVDFYEVDQVFIKCSNGENLAVLINIFNTVEESLYELFSVESAISNFDEYTLNRANKLLNILEANYRLMKIEGSI